MKKVVILEEGDYNLILHDLNVCKDIIKHMRKTKNVGRMEKSLDHLLELLTGQDSSMRDLKNRIDLVKSLATVDWR